MYDKLQYIKYSAIYIAIQYILHTNASAARAARSRSWSLVSTRPTVPLAIIDIIIIIVIIIVITITITIINIIIIVVVFCFYCEGRLQGITLHYFVHLPTVYNYISSAESSFIKQGVGSEGCPHD